MEMELSNDFVELNDYEIIQMDDDDTSAIRIDSSERNDSNISSVETIVEEYLNQFKSRVRQSAAELESKIEEDFRLFQESIKRKREAFPKSQQRWDIVDKQFEESFKEIKIKDKLEQVIRAHEPRLKNLQYRYFGGDRAAGAEDIQGVARRLDEYFKGKLPLDDREVQALLMRLSSALEVQSRYDPTEHSAVLQLFRSGVVPPILPWNGRIS